YAVQRTWSNKAIAASDDPCVPAPAPSAAPFFAAVPVLSDTVKVTSYGQTILTKGASIAVGQSKTIDVVLYSDAPVGPWTIAAADAPYYGVPPTQQHLSFAFDETHGTNGDHVKLTITVQSYDAQSGAAPFVVTSTIGQHTNTWFGVVGQ